MSARLRGTQVVPATKAAHSDGAGSPSWRSASRCPCTGDAVDLRVFDVHSRAQRPMRGEPNKNLRSHADDDANYAVEL